MGLFDSIFGGGGKVDTSGMEKATNRAIDLQERMYDEGKERVQPWYQAGSSAVSRLSDLLGLSGGSVQTRDQIYNKLLPQYTAAPSSGKRTTPAEYNLTNLQGISGDDLTALKSYRPDLLDSNAFQQKYGKYGTGYEAERANQINAFLNSHSPAASPTTDYNALNSAVDAQLAGQQTPDDYGSLMQNFDMSKYQEDPGYQFRLAEGEKALNRAMAAKGKTMTPEALKALTEYNSGMASQEYGNSYNRYNTDRNTIYNMLAGVSGVGQNAANSQVAQGQNYANTVGDLTMGLANAQAAAQQAKASQPSIFSQLMNAGGQAAAMYAAFSDIRLKENIREIDEIDGVKRYEFNYNGDPQRYVGAMAQQVIDVIPDAVHLHESGMYMVDYSKLPFQMESACQ